MTFIKVFETENKHSAHTLGSGTLEVLATPAVVAFAENACQERIKGLLKVEESSVGTVLEIQHVRASKIGEDITLEVKLVKEVDNQFEFEFTATVSEKVVARGTHSRVSVDINRFLNRLN